MIKLTDILKEINIQKKEKEASGSRHAIYLSKLNPNTIIKIANTDSEYGGDEYNTIDLDSLELFKKHPDIFPKVYKITDRYAVIEKLNDIKAQDELEDLYNQVIESDTEFSEYMKDKYTRYDRDYNEFSTDIYEYMEEEGKNPSDFDEVYTKIKNGALLKKYVLFIFKVTKLISQSLDIHNSQFGYTSEGQIKLLDI